MKLKIIQYGGEETLIDCDSFEFRTNHVSNWIRIIYNDGEDELMIRNVCVIKTEEKKPG